MYVPPCGCSYDCCGCISSHAVSVTEIESYDDEFSYFTALVSSIRNV
jgi:organic radical activating enzyme